jgi:hypothetical protein
VVFASQPVPGLALSSLSKTRKSNPCSNYDQTGGNPATEPARAANGRLVREKRAEPGGQNHQESSL